MMQTLLTATTALLLAASLTPAAHADCPSNRTFVVTNIYDIDGEPLAVLNLTVGFTYTFTLQNPSGHPFMLTADPNGGPGTSPLPTSSGVSCFCQGCGTCTRRTITFTPVATLANSTVYYQCTVHPAMGNAINILPAPAITLNATPGPTHVCAGSNASFTVSAVSNETGNPGYQWFRGGEPLADAPGSVSGATTSTLTLHSVTSAQQGEITCRVSAPCKSVITAPAPFTVSACCPADFGMQGGLSGADGLLNNNDFIAFINMFFADDTRADVGTTGATPASDGLLNNNDFVVYIDRFFAGC